MSAADVATFERERARLEALGYRMLGSMVDAQDAVQDGWLRWERLGADGRAAIDNPAAWCTTVVSRLALDRLRSVRHEREQYVGPWLPEPVAATPDPADSAELAESLTLGFLTVLERLGPVERAAFLLADVFGEPFSTVAEVVGRSEDACRQAASRARRRLRDEHRRVPVEHGEGLMVAFLGACIDGDVDRLRTLLAADAVVISDGGALVHAARRPVVGIDRVTRLLINLSSRLSSDVRPELATINGEPGLIGWLDGRPMMVIALEVRDGVIGAVRIMVNPDKLRALVA